MAVLLITGCSSTPVSAPTPAPSPATRGSSPTAVRSPSAALSSPAATVGAGPKAPTCVGRQLTALAVTGGSVASQPFEVVAFRNISTTPCSLSGYPGLSAYTSRNGAERKVWITVRHGSIYERNDLGSRTVTMTPGGEAWFDLGSVMAYQGGLDAVSMNRFILYPPGASRPPGRAYPITVTALYPPSLGTAGRVGLPSAVAPAGAVLTAYLNAVVSGDCARADELVLPTAYGDGDLCGGGTAHLVIDRWRSTEPPRAVGPLRIFATEAHVLSGLPDGESMPTWMTWFLEFRHTPRGWRLASGGTGP
jgi:hypothetical protein